MVYPRGFVQSESTTSVMLQMCLHFNIYLSVVMGVTESFVLAHKLKTYEQDVFGQVLTPLTFGVWGATEVFRLWIGFTGNLRERLPQMAVFFLLSIFPQLPCLLYLTQLQRMQMPYESILGGLLAAITMAELFITYFTIRALVRKQNSSYMRLVEQPDKFDSPQAM